MENLTRFIIVQKKDVFLKKASWKKLGISLLALLILIGIGLSFAANHLVNYAISRQGAGGKRQISQTVQSKSPQGNSARKKINANKQKYKEAVALFVKEHKEEIATIQSKDNLQLTGYYFRQEDSHKWVILVHGYRSNHKNMYDYALEYFKQGYNVLVPEQRAVGLSAGNYIGMGWLEKEDMQAWITWVLQQDKLASIVLHGNSMGAATVLMLSGDETPEQVKAFVSDSAYTSVWAIFASELKLRFKLPEFPLMYFADVIANLKAGYRFSRASAVEQVKKSTKPILFIHGVKDNFVPYAMLSELTAAKVEGKKQVLTAPNAGHVEALYDLGKDYFQTVFAFLNELNN